MICPRCETPSLVEREREGLIVDSCSTCRGVWLDRGELEKLIARAVSEFEQPAYAATNQPHPGQAQPTAPPPLGQQYHYPAQPQYRAPSAASSHYDDPPSSRDPRRGYVDPRGAYPSSDPHLRPKRKRHWLESLGEIFD
jgi:uncharacterized protein